MTDKLDDIQENLEIEADEWILNPEQMLFMMEHHNLIIESYTNEDMAALRQLSNTHEYMTIFGDMSFDEAFDRYESMLEG